MGKSKKTRWRTFSFDGSKDETQINDDVKVNGSTDLSSQKYSQILGDHHTNYLPHNKNHTSAAAAVHHNFKTRSYNKENYYNQRSIAAKNNLASRNSWQRSNSSAFRATASSLKDSSSSNIKSEENGKSGFSDIEKQDNSHITAEPIKFNEDEYTRITTPRQDVLFKKGYLSRMNSNKSANNNLSSTATVDSTGPNSIATTATNSDPESSLSVSTLSPATTPSMDFGQMDSQDFTTAAAAPVYYPGYYDESGMLVFPMYNGYNYGSTSPVYLMPYPYQYDPFFMAPTPNTDEVVSASDNTEEQNGDAENTEGNEKTESDDAKENNQIAEEEQNNNNDADDVNDDDDEKDVKQEQQQKESEVTSTNELNEQNEQTPKCFPVYANELGYVFPYANGFYNGFYYYNGMPTSSRPPKGKRRKRYSSSRSSHSHPPPPRSTAETTTDYSDDDGGNSTHNRRYYSRYSHNNSHHHHHHHNGWNHHHHYSHSNGYNQYHYNSSKYFHKNHIEQNANQAPIEATSEKELLAHHESNLNADVGEFYPRVHLCNNSQPLPPKQQQQQQRTTTQTNEPEQAATNDLEKQQQQKSAQSKSEALLKSINNINTKPSHTSKSMGRVNKKEIMDGIKLMEQQNINLKATSKAQLKMASNSIDADVEWNVIKKGKKVKVVNDVEVIKKDSMSSAEEAKQQQREASQEPPVSNKKTITSAMQASVTNITNNNSNNNIAKSKKSKSKGSKKKKNFSMIKQDGFEIIEPDFSSHKGSEEVALDASEEDDEMTVVEDEQEEIQLMNDNNAIECEQTQISNEPEHDKNLKGEEEDKNDVIQIVENELKKEEEQEEVQAELISDEIKVQEEILKVFNVELSQKDDDDAVIDISDEEICRKTSIEIDLSIAQEIAIINTKPAKKQQQQKQEEIVIEQEKASEKEEQIFEDSDYFNDRKNIAELERDLVENLKILDDGIDIKSPVINPLYDFPITSAVRKWLQEKQHESFENLFRVENFKKLSELYDECDDDEDDDESDISDSPQKSETTDSDYASDIQVKLNGSPASSNAKLTSKCNNKLIVKESFCALM